MKKTISLYASLLVLFALLVTPLGACGPSPTSMPAVVSTEPPAPTDTAPPAPTDTLPPPPTDTPPPPPTDTPPAANLFQPEGGGFSIVPPYPLQENTQSVDTDAGPIEVHMFVADQGQQAWLVGYSDYPEAIVQASDPATMLAGARDGAVGNVNGQLISDAEVSLNGYPGRDFSATVTQNGQEFVLRQRVYMVGNRLYQVVVIIPEGEENSAEVEDFFQSFQLTGE